MSSCAVNDEFNPFIFTIGNLNKGIYIIHSGSFGALDESQHLTTLKPRYIIGVRNLLVTAIETATVVALQDSEVFFLRKEDFIQVQKAHESAVEMIQKSAQNQIMKNRAEKSQKTNRNSDEDIFALNKRTNEKQVRLTGSTEEDDGIHDSSSSLEWSPKFTRNKSFKTANGEANCTSSGFDIFNSLFDNTIARSMNETAVTSAGISKSSNAIENAVAETSSIAALMVIEPLPPTYRELTAKQKQELLGQRMLAAPYSITRLPKKLRKEVFASPLGRADVPPIDTDEHMFHLERPRVPLFNLYGTAATVTFKPISINPTHSFTGLFHTGAPGIIRFSVIQTRTSSDDPFCPCVALKLLVDGQPSVDIIAAGSLHGQWVVDSKSSMRRPDNNFFANELSTSPHKHNTLHMLVWPFMPHDSYAYINKAAHWKALGVAEAARVTAKGQILNPDQVVTPEKLIFTPSKAGMQLLDKAAQLDFRAQLAGVPVKSVLYTIHAYIGPNSPAEPLGVIVLESVLTSSKYSDERLAFHHPLLL